MKLLYYTLEGFDTPNPNNHLAQTMIDQFLQKDIEVDLIQSNRGGDQGIPEILQKRNKLNIYNVKRKKIDKEDFIKRYISEMVFPLKALKMVIQEKQCDRIYVQSNATIVWSLILFKVILHKPITYVIYDIFPNQLKMLGIVDGGILYKCLSALQKIAYKIADNIIVLSEDMKRTLVREEKIPKDKIYVISPWYDEKIFKCIKKNENIIYDELHLNKEKFLVQYAGSLGQNFDYNFILELAEELKNDTDIQIVLIGNGVKRNTIVSEIKKRKLNNIVLREMQPLEKICNVYNACDVGIVPLKKGVIKCGFPSKVCQLMICGKPIISSVEESKYSQFINSGFGFAGYKDIKNTASFIRKIHVEKESYTKISNKCILYAQKYYGCAFNCNKLIDILKMKK